MTNIDYSGALNMLIWICAGGLGLAFCVLLVVLLMWLAVKLFPD